MPAPIAGAGDAACFLISAVSGYGLPKLVTWLGRRVVEARALSQPDDVDDGAVAGGA
jgi:hypothetical protein